MNNPLIILHNTVAEQFCDIHQVINPSFSEKEPYIQRQEVMTIAFSYQDKFGCVCEAGGYCTCLNNCGIIFFVL